MVLLIAMLGSIILTTRLVLVDGDKPSPSFKDLHPEDKLPPAKPSAIAHILEQRQREET